MIKINILNQKLIVTDDYQQFWVNFEWFLSLFQISCVNGYCKAKSKQKRYFLVSKTHFKILFLGYFIPQLFLCKKLGQKSP